MIKSFFIIPKIKNPNNYPTETNHKKLQVVLHPYSWTDTGFENYENFKTLINQKNRELVESINSECNNFPQELL
jgi:predicted N-acyltransferase